MNPGITILRTQASTIAESYLRALGPDVKSIYLTLDPETGKSAHATALAEAKTVFSQFPELFAPDRRILLEVPAEMAPLMVFSNLLRGYRKAGESRERNEHILVVTDQGATSYDANAAFRLGAGSLHREVSQIILAELGTLEDAAPIITVDQAGPTLPIVGPAFTNQAMTATSGSGITTELAAAFEKARGTASLTQVPTKVGWSLGDPPIEPTTDPLATLREAALVAQPGDVLEFRQADGTSVMLEFAGPETNP